MLVTFAYPYILFFGLPAWLLIVLWHWFKSKPIFYKYSLVKILATYKGAQNYKRFFYILRALSLLLLLIALARPQEPDKRTELPVEGVPMILALDASGSMQLLMDLQDRRTRFEVATQEAIKFIEKRKNDPIGLVLFARDVITRSPLTIDKKMLATIIEDTQIGSINPEGTLLSWGLVAALNRLRNSPAKSKIIILLTDGVSSEGDLNISEPIALAKKLGVKIYTIGIGSEIAYFNPFGNGKQYDGKLLSAIAEQTQGQFFEARKPKDLANIYSSIDKLEKTEFVAPTYQCYFELYQPVILLVFILTFIELLLTTWLRLRL